MSCPEGLALPEVTVRRSQVLNAKRRIPVDVLQTLLTMHLHLLYLVQPTFLKINTNDSIMDKISSAKIKTKRIKNLGNCKCCFEVPEKNTRDNEASREAKI